MPSMSIADQTNQNSVVMSRKAPRYAHTRLHYMHNDMLLLWAYNYEFELINYCQNNNNINN